MSRPEYMDWPEYETQKKSQVGVEVDPPMNTKKPKNIKIMHAEKDCTTENQNS